MNTWIARCLAGTLGCGMLALLAALLATLLTAGGDDHGGRALRVTALLLGVIAAAGIATLVVLLSVLQLGLVAKQETSAAVEEPSA